MPRVDPPYPSFAFVLSSPPEPRNARSSRLPAYRVSHMGRFHPYPRVAPGRCTDRLMVCPRAPRRDDYASISRMSILDPQNTVDYRYAEDPLWEEPVLESGEVTENGENLLADAEAPPAPNHCESSGDETAATPPATESPSTRSKLVVTLSDALAVLRRYLSRQALKNFLKPEQLKRP
ncbi:hypothetical protein OH77DRAFT_23193 [Trametes cingulata]|nr:hypothetical protein OH77DRAFT_23193 [Trametes cingulata]